MCIRDRPEKGHLLKSGEELLKHLKEYRVDETSSYEIGNQITVKNFEVGQKVDISGKSMGRGFAGYQKRHGFSRGPMTLTLNKASIAAFICGLAAL